MTPAARVAFGCAAVLAVGASACGDDDEETLVLGDDAVIEYQYGDSSVPPEYHRSYSLTIRQDEVHVVVDSYGDILQDTTVPLPSEVWADLADTTPVQDVSGSVEQDDDGCSGGTSRSITIESGGETQLTSDFSVGCDRNDEAAETLDAYVQPVIDAIPNWDELLE